MSYLEDKIKAAQAARQARHAQDASEQIIRDAELNHMKQQRVDFLKATQAVTIPMPLYALWLSVYLQQGGEISHSYDRDFETPGRVVSGGHGVGVDPLHFEPIPPTADYNYTGFHNWMPTNRRSTEVALHRTSTLSLRRSPQIPEGYGALSMTVLVMTDLVNIDLTPAKNDHRNGWEWGHTQVLTLRKDGRRLVAWTNNPSSVKSYTDVENFILRAPLKEMTKNYFEAITA